LIDRKMRTVTREKPLDYLIDKMAQGRKLRQQTGTGEFNARRDKVRITQKVFWLDRFYLQRETFGWWRSTG
jgi:hypothetical protein